MSARKIFKGKLTLDAGCGFGDFIGNDPENFVGIDFNRKFLESKSKKGYTLMVASVTQLPFRERVFYGINSSRVIEHLESNNAYRMLSEFERILNNAGQIYIESEMPTKSFWDTFSHIKPYPPKAIRKMLSEKHIESFLPLNNLEVTKVFYLGKHFSVRSLSLAASFVANFFGLGRIQYVVIVEPKKPEGDKP